MTTKTVGDLGETVACNFLTRRGFTVHERNYAKQWGELDIIVQKKTHTYFVEVKTVSHETKLALEQAITRETWQPEDLVDAAKVKQLKKIINTWLNEKEYLGEWSIIIAAVHLVPAERYATVKLLEDVVFEQ